MIKDYEAYLSGFDDFERTVPLHHIAQESVITINMLLAHLNPCEIISKPKGIRSSFRWAVDITDPSTAADSSFQDGLVFIGPAEFIPKFLETHTLPIGTLFIALTENGCVPDGLPIRCLVIKQKREYMHYVKRIQGLFIAMWLWEMELSHVTYSRDKSIQRKKLQTLLNMKCPFASEFLCITDTGFNLIAYSENVTPPALFYKTLVEDGCYNLNEIEYLKDKVLSKVNLRNSIAVCEPDELCPFYSIHKPIFIDGSYVFHLTMVCKDGHFLDSRKDVFSVLSTYVTAICTEFWEDHLEVESLCHKVLIRMIENRAMSPAYINTQLKATVIPETEYFRLARYRINPDLSYENIRKALRAAIELIPGYCYPFMYHGDLLVLLCSPTNNLAGISIRKTLHRTEEVMFKPHDLACAISQSFRYIDDIAIAYKQTTDALRCEKLLKAAYPMGYDGKGSFPVIPFEHILQFILVDGSMDPEMHASVFANSIIKLLSEEDKKQGSDFLGLLWEYLCTECNASEVAKKLNMHRNTVVYHINKFERRFDVSLDLPMVRQRLYLDFINHYSKNYE